MSRSLNRVTLIGNLGVDPEIRIIGIKKVAHFSLATSRRWRGATGESQEKVEWHRCVAWDRSPDTEGLATIIERYARKGDKLYVEGQIEYRQYEDRTKQTRQVTEINVRDIVLLPSTATSIRHNAKVETSSLGALPVHA